MEDGTDTLGSDEGQVSADATQVNAIGNGGQNVAAPSADGGAAGSIAAPATSQARVSVAAASSDGGAAPVDDLEFRPYDRHWEDFSKGSHLRTRGMTITETHIVNWANMAGDWLPLHVDHNVSSKTPFRSVIAHGPLTLSLALGLVVQSGFFGDSVIAWLGLDEVRLPKPVLPGDTIYVEVEVIEHATTSKPHRGRVTLGYHVVNQRDETVLTFTSGFLMHRRDENSPA